MDIDLVYLWVDGSDPVWAAKKRAYLPDSENTSQRQDAVGDCRFVSNDEIKYSLRSVEKYAPWIRRIYIVTDNQRPEWLDTSNPRIRIVDHREIMPEKYLPLFNSLPLEFNLDEIPGLSEHFLYANDDMLFGAPTEPSFFFDGRGLPIVRLKVQSLKRHLNETYSYQLYHMLQAVERKYGKRYSLVPHHNIDAYRISDIKACKADFREQIERSCTSRFRNREDMQRSVVLYSVLARCGAKMRKVTRFNKVHGVWSFLLSAFGRSCGSDSRCIPINTADPEAVMAKYNPTLFCVNDSELSTNEDRIRIKEFLEKLFPEKSQFEL